MDRDRERKLVELVKRGKSAKDLLDFTAEFYEMEKGRTIVDLLQSNKDSDMIRADMRAAKRLVDYIKGIVIKGGIAEKKLQEDK